MMEPGIERGMDRASARAPARAFGRSLAIGAPTGPRGAFRPAALAANARPRVMAVSSGGGHWVELCRIRAAFAGLDVFYVSPDPSAAPGLGARHYAIPDVTRRDRWRFAPLAARLLRILARERPDVVITTGAAPGLVALALAKGLLGARTIWIDSLAAAETLSLSARLARPVADAWLTQWSHLARETGPEYWGAMV